MQPQCRRRSFLRVAGASMLAPIVAPSLRAGVARSAPSSPVGIARCRRYDPGAVLAELKGLMDKLGGLRPLVEGKTVAVKVNLVGNVHQDSHGKSASRTYQIHPTIVRALARLLEDAGARRIRFLESTHQHQAFEPYLMAAGWDLNELTAAKIPVEFEDTRNLGRRKSYEEIKVPWGGSLYPAYHISRAYHECDVYVSLAKLKNHFTAGVTLGMKNNFGVTPIALYGQAAHDEESTNSRAMFHDGRDEPPAGVPGELSRTTPRNTSYRVPRHTVDSVGIRPIDLVIIDGVESTSGGEGPWVGQTQPQEPGLLIAGRNVVCVDSIATAVMGYDPTAPRATGVFPGDNHLTLAAELGLGTNDPAQIEVVGLPLAKARHPYNWLPAQRDI